VHRSGTPRCGRSTPSVDVQRASAGFRRVQVHRPPITQASLDRPRELVGQYLVLVSLEAREGRLRDLPGVGLRDVVPLVMSVSMKLTCRARTKVLWFRRSVRRALVKLHAADLVGEYAASTGRETQAASDRMFTIAPPPFPERMGANAWLTRTVPK
jgi:hypothetical protein